MLNREVAKNALDDPAHQAAPDHHRGERHRRGGSFGGDWRHPPLSVAAKARQLRRMIGPCPSSTKRK